MTKWNVNAPLKTNVVRNTVEDVMTYAKKAGSHRLDFLFEFATEVRRLCVKAGIDWRLVIAHSKVETGDPADGRGWRSPAWRERGNPGGIGIEDGGVDRGFVFVDGKQAARAMVVHYAAYIYGRYGNWPVQVQDALGPYRKLDPKFDLMPPEYYGSVSKLSDLQEKWWTADEGSSNIAAAAQTIFGDFDSGGTTKPTKPEIIGEYPQPPWISSYRIGETHNIGTGRDPDATRVGRILGSCHHTSEGFFEGNRSVYSDPSFGGLTDAQVGGPWDVGGKWDGVLEVFIDPYNSKVVPWSNGTVGADREPYGDGDDFVTAYGRAAVNIRLRSIETTDGGIPNRSKGGRQIESLCLWTGFVHAVEAKQTPEEFEWNMHHREFGVQHQQCPGLWIIENVDLIQARTKEIMSAYLYGTPLSRPILVTYPPGWTGKRFPLPPVAGTKPPKPDTGYADPMDYPELVADLKSGKPRDHVIDGITFEADIEKSRVIRDTRRLQTFDTRSDAPVVGPKIKAGTAVTTWWRARKGKQEFRITPHLTVLHDGSLEPITLRKSLVPTG